MTNKETLAAKDLHIVPYCFYLNAIHTFLFSIEPCTCYITTWWHFRRGSATNRGTHTLCVYLHPLDYTSGNSSKSAIWNAHLMICPSLVTYLHSSLVYLLHPGHLQRGWSVCKQGLNNVMQNCCAVLPAKALHSEWLVQHTETQLLISLCDYMG